eukprot:m.77146 g.77146  ORF g.77146 m.77146 type:complete len:398 (-) comp9115_c0_seq2:2733-3926(-)
MEGRFKQASNRKAHVPPRIVPKRERAEKGLNCTCGPVRKIRWAAECFLPEDGPASWRAPHRCRRRCVDGTARHARAWSPLPPRAGGRRYCCSRCCQTRHCGDREAGCLPRTKTHLASSSMHGQSQDQSVVPVCPRRTTVATRCCCPMWSSWTHPTLHHHRSRQNRSRTETWCAASQCGSEVPHCPVQVGWPCHGHDRARAARRYSSVAATRAPASTCRSPWRSSRTWSVVAWPIFWLSVGSASVVFVTWSPPACQGGTQPRPLGSAAPSSPLSSTARPSWTSCPWGPSPLAPRLLLLRFGRQLVLIRQEGFESGLSHLNSPPAPRATASPPGPFVCCPHFVSSYLYLLLKQADRLWRRPRIECQPVQQRPPVPMALGGVAAWYITLLVVHALLVGAP